jgi:hypothetical protein
MSTMNIYKAVLQQIWQYISQRKHCLNNNINETTEQMNQNLIKEFNKCREFYSEHATVSPNAIFWSNKEIMQREINLINIIEPHLKAVLTQYILPDLPFLLKLSTYLTMTTENLEKEINVDGEQARRLRLHLDYIEQIIKPYLPEIHLLQLPYILISANYDKDTSIYIKIHDYLKHTLEVIQHNINIYNNCIITYTTTNRNATYEEMSRWKKPYENLEHEKQRLNNLLQFFHVILQNVEQPTARQMMSNLDGKSELFFETITTYLITKQDDLLYQQNELKQSYNLDTHKQKMLQLQIDKIQQYIDEVGPAYEEIMKLKAAWATKDDDSITI